MDSNLKLSIENRRATSEITFKKRSETENLITFLFLAEKFSKEIIEDGISVYFWRPFSSTNTTIGFYRIYSEPLYGKLKKIKLAYQFADIMIDCFVHNNGPFEAKSIFVV